MKRIVDFTVYTLLIVLIALCFIECKLYTNITGDKNFQYWDYEISHDNVRFEQNLPYDKNKADIIVAGGGSVFGNGLKQEKTLPYLLQKATKQRVFNRGYYRTGVQHILWQIENSEFFARKDINPEYLIYVFEPSHLDIMYKNYYHRIDTVKYIRYGIVDGELKMLPLNEPLKDWFRQTLIGKTATDIVSFLKYPKKAKYDFLKLHIDTIQKRLKEKFPNTKIIIIFYGRDFSMKDLQISKNLYPKDDENIKTIFYSKTNNWIYLIPQLKEIIGKK